MSPEEVKRARVARYMTAFQKECAIETGQLHAIIETIFDVMLHPPELYVDAAVMRKLHDATGMEMLKCKEALLRNENDFNAAMRSLGFVF